MIKASGVILKDKKSGMVLFLKRAPTADMPGTWCFPGGRIEDGETPEIAAARECAEETGYGPKGLRLVCRTITQLAPPTAGALGGGGAPDSPPGAPPLAAPDSVDFTTYVTEVAEQPTVILNDEHVGQAWAPADQPPEPLHPGCRIALDMVTADELGCARYMRDGILSSPHKYMNVTLFNMRVTGTRVAYRRAKDEFVWRDPSHYLNDEFLARCNGLPVIFEHPEKAVLNSQEFADRVVGTILLPYIRGDEVWGIAKIYDNDAIRVMSDPDKPLSTSPAIVLGDPKDSTKLTMDDGSVILIEGRPSLLDHLAICERGVWDKGGDPTGIIINDSNTKETGDMDKTEVTKIVAEVVADAMKDRIQADSDNGGKLDKVLKGIDSIAARCDSLEEAEAKRVAADKSKADADDKEAKEKADADEKAVAKEKADADEKAEKEKADAEEEAKKKADADPKIMARIADVEKRLPVHITDADYAALTTAQADADVVFQAFGDSAPRPLNGESPLAYRRRVASTLKVHSPDWKGVDMIALADDAFAIAEKRVYADSATAAMNPIDLPDGQMRPITRTDRVTGHRVTTFTGRRSFVRDFTQVNRRVTGFKQRNADRS